MSRSNVPTLQAVRHVAISPRADLGTEFQIFDADTAGDATG
ncbi:hypothetical protein QA640_06780 [Bradyrhizobium sp. CB82]|nr:hypothetical protein [Bradyrhizobium sp. CB82]WFU42177.1 hypothetical protein QA640_06780 [Bradyrhizobium sp. CB82]